MKKNIEKIYYPESDGKPMAETDLHAELLILMRELLKLIFPEAYVSGNICLYYEEGNPKKMISPDSLLSIKGRSGQKRTYKTWLEPPIDLVIEFTSKSTKKEDHVKKKKIYAEIMKVPVYVIFDPEKIVLEAFLLTDGEYQAIEADDLNQYYLSHIDLYVKEENGLLRFLDRKGELILTQKERVEMAVHKAGWEGEQREGAELKVKRESEQREAAELKAKREAKRADNESKRAEDEANQRKLAEKRITQLEALLKKREELD